MINSCISPVFIWVGYPNGILFMCKCIHMNVYEYVYKVKACLFKHKWNVLHNKKCVSDKYIYIFIYNVYIHNWWSVGSKHSSQIVLAKIHRTIKKKYLNILIQKLIGWMWPCFCCNSMMIKSPGTDEQVDAAHRFSSQLDFWFPRKSYLNWTPTPNEYEYCPSWPIWGLLVTSGSHYYHSSFMMIA